MRIVADLLAGIHQVQRIEDIFDLLEDSIQRSVLRAQKTGARQSVAVLTTDRAADVEHGLIKITSDRFESRRVGRRGVRQKRSQVNLSRRRM